MTGDTTDHASGRGTLSRSLRFLLPAVLTLAAGAAEKVTFDDHIRPIFEQSCLNCHNPDKRKGGLDLSNYAAALQGGSGGKIAEPGDGAGSRLFTSVTHSSENKMPPEGDKIPAEQANLIRAWVDGGLLETRNSAAKQSTGPKIAKLEIDATSKPDGPPPMPQHVSLEPAVVAARSTSIADLASSPWAPLLAITGQKQVLLYNTDTLQLAAVLPFDAGQPETVSFHPTGKYLLAGGGVAGKSGTTITWDVASGRELMRNGREFDSVLDASLRSDLGAVATGGPSRLIKLWDTQTGEEAKSIKKHTDWITALAFSPDGILLATADRNGGAWVWEAAGGNEFHTLRAHQAGITALRWRADSNLLATGSEDGQLIFWEMNNGGEVKKIAAHNGGVLALDYTRDGRFISSGRDKRVKVWKADFTMEKELPPFGDLVVEVAFSHDGQRYFTAEWGGKVTAWDTATFAPVGELDANPPRIADRIASLQNTIAAMPAEIAAAQAKVQQAANALTNARNAHLAAVTARDEAIKRKEPLVLERSQLGQEWNQLEARRNQITTEREQHRAKAEAARQKLIQHQEALTKASGDLAALGETPLDEEGNRLAAEVAALQAAAAGQPGDAALKARAGEAAAKLQAHKQMLSNNDAQRASAHDLVNQLTAQLNGFQNEITTADGLWAQYEPEWVAIEARRAAITARRDLIHPALAELERTIPELEKAIQPAQEQITAKEAEAAPPQAALGELQAREGHLRTHLAFWQAAALNHEALQAAARHEALKREQDEALSAFTELTRQLGTLREQLPTAADEAARRKLEASIADLTTQLADLRATIDQRAPELATRAQEAQSLQSRYKELTQ